MRGLITTLVLSLCLAASAVYLDGKQLPKDFVYGCAVAAYQVEGGWEEDGKGKSIWDVYCQAGNCALKATGNVADNFYHTYKQDIPLFKKALGINSFSFSFAWSRIFPQGRGEVNQKGVEYYKKVLKAAKSNGLKTSCTLYHWDIPDALFQEYHAFQSEKLVEDFRNYSKTMFKLFGDRCDYWVTFNEPKVICTHGYGPAPNMAPGLKGPLIDQYTCGHNLLLSHAAAKEEHKKLGLKTPVGMKLDHMPLVPFNKNDAKDVAAADRANDFEIGWFVSPITTGAYPDALTQAYGSSFPKFTPQQSASLLNSLDFLGLDPYTAAWASPLANCDQNTMSNDYPMCVNKFQTTADNRTIGVPTGSSWNFLDPEDSVYGGLKLLIDRYNTSSLPLWISETGMSQINEPNLPLEQKINDAPRVEWYRRTLHSVKKLIDEGVPVTGFVPWACLDNMEWSMGYTERFGVIGIKYGADGQGSQDRFVKKSAGYLKSVLDKGEKIDH